ncbi:MAG: family 43 glycosylhydrolase [Lacunisphaera sp.]|nr:family 43 glycosylhydrolase [Lacunisphaera sp.]
MKTASLHCGRLVLLGLALATAPLAAEPFPFRIPPKKPDRPLSEAMNRLYDQYMALMPEDSELYSNFRYTPLKGLDYHDGDGTISRRDPSKVIKVDGKYYVWYTHRRTTTSAQGAAKATDTIPSSDWDLCEIWYATSTDGFTWTEKGVAVPRPPKPQPGWRSACTPDILIWKGKYYLYYQAFADVSGRRGDDCPVAVSYADSPNGPWTSANKIVILNGAPGEWDQYSIHDPYPLVYKGKIYLYYKSDWNGKPVLLRATGLATADDPLGPFTKCPLNPVINSGHETTLFPFKGGIAAIAQHNGLEHNTIQYAPDGINFHVESTTTFPPIAAGPYVPDAFTDTTDGRGITWGIAHFTTAGESRATQHSILTRFDCDLSQDVNDPEMKKTDLSLRPEIYFSQTLSRAQQERITKETRTDLQKP